ncbi:MAG: amino acid permease [Nitrososphaerales archaeon]
MPYRLGIVRPFALIVKTLMIPAGILILALSLGYLINEFSFLSQSTSGLLGISDIGILVAVLGAILSASMLVAALPASIRVKFEKISFGDTRPGVYGFGTILAIGIGATLGSPLFILIPLNILQYELVSLLSLVIATVLSVLMAKLYADMYTITQARNLESVGGPSFVRAACGTRSVRYFVSRLSMSVANTALAAYSAIIFVLFDFQYMPQLLSYYGIVGTPQFVIVYAIVILFGAWFLMNSILESRFIHVIGRVQIILTVIMIIILISHSILLGNTGSWNLSGIAGLGSVGIGWGWVFALITNTAYLYLLFFGFQEIQALEKDALPTSPLPIVSWIKRRYKVEKHRYLGIAMISSVVIAAGINILYALAVFASHPALAELQKSSIPALYISKIFLGVNQETIMAVAFLIATFTTFVPSFMAATRHLSALGEDGFLPRSVAKNSWLFILVSIMLLAIAGQDFLVNVTDFMVLISLGLISLSAIWIRRKGESIFSSSGPLALVVGITCFVVGAAIYFISSTVAVFGSIAIAIAYLIYDIYELGSFGTQLFLGIFDLFAYLIIAYYPHTSFSPAVPLFSRYAPFLATTDVLSIVLLLSAILLFSNAIVDYAIMNTRK